MNILSTTARPPEISCFSFDEKIPNIGLLSLAAMLKSADHICHYKDPYCFPADTYDSKFLKEKDIDVICIYLTTVCYEDVLRQLKFIKKEHPKIRTLVGGPGVNVLTDKRLIELFSGLAGIIVRGEAENHINRLVFMTNNEEIQIINCGIVKNLDELPMPAYDLLREDYDYLSISTSRGCPRMCTFCSNAGTIGRDYRWISSQKIINIIKYLQDTRGIKQVYFRENNFCINRDRVLEFCHALKANSIDIKWRCEASTKDLDEEMLGAMKSSNCDGLYIGFESNSEDVLSELKPGFKVVDNYKIMELCNEIGIKVYGSFIVGSPFEGDIELQHTIDFIGRYKFEVAWMNVFVGMPGSPLYDKIDFAYEDKYGIRFTDKYNRMADRFYGEHIKFRVP